MRVAVVLAGLAVIDAVDGEGAEAENVRFDSDPLTFFHVDAVGGARPLQRASLAIEQTCNRGTSSVSETGSKHTKKKCHCVAFAVADRHLGLGFRGAAVDRSLRRAPSAEGVK